MRGFTAPETREGGRGGRSVNWLAWIDVALRKDSILEKTICLALPLSKQLGQEPDTT